MAAKCELALIFEVYHDKYVEVLNKPKYAALYEARCFQWHHNIHLFIFRILHTHNVINTGKDIIDCMV